VAILVFGAVEKDGFRGREARAQEPAEPECLPYPSHAGRQIFSSVAARGIEIRILPPLRSDLRCRAHVVHLLSGRRLHPSAATARIDPDPGSAKRDGSDGAKKLFLIHISTRPCISRRPLSLASRSVANESADVCNSPSLSKISQRWRSTSASHDLIIK
jgi:hypothetical protein